MTHNSCDTLLNDLFSWADQQELTHGMALVGSTVSEALYLVSLSNRRYCRLTHKFAKTGRYASEEENGEDMCQIQAPISFREFKKIVWERAIRNSAS